MKDLLWDCLSVAGGGLVITGLALIHLPTALIFAGGVLAIVGLWGAWRETRVRGPQPDAEAETDNPRG